MAVTPAGPGSNVRGQKVVLSMIGFVTYSLLAVCSCSADRPSAGQPPPRKEAGSVSGLAGAATIVNVPRQAGPWVRLDAPRRITGDTIFDYMDGAGELYLAYRFGHLDVYEYSAPEKALGAIKVELYWMKGSDDAFGLLSTDWGGEAVDLRASTQDRGGGAAGAPPRPSRGLTLAVPPHDALYGGGLLRFWSGDLYGRIMATRETAQSRAQVLAIARSIVGGRPAGDRPPAILSRVPARFGEQFVLRPDRTVFLRSHYVLNAAYYLAPDDVLGLGPEVDASIGEYRSAGAGGMPVRVIQVAYPSIDAAAAALRTFLTKYVQPPAARAEGRPAAARGEEGWVGWAAEGRLLAVVLGAPGEKDAKELARAALSALTNHETVTRSVFPAEARIRNVSPSRRDGP